MFELCSVHPVCTLVKVLSKRKTILFILGQKVN